MAGEQESGNGREKRKRWLFALTRDLMKMSTKNNINFIKKLIFIRRKQNKTKFFLYFKRLELKSLKKSQLWNIYNFYGITYRCKYRWYCIHISTCTHASCTVPGLSLPCCTCIHLQALWPCLCGSAALQPVEVLYPSAVRDIQDKSGYSAWQPPV